MRAGALDADPPRLFLLFFFRLYCTFFSSFLLTPSIPRQGAGGEPGLPQERPVLRLPAAAQDAETEPQAAAAGRAGAPGGVRDKEARAGDETAGRPGGDTCIRTCMRKPRMNCQECLKIGLVPEQL